MNIKATCGCGATFEAQPANSGYHEYDKTAHTNAERVAVAEAFKHWADSHVGCGRPPEVLRVLQDARFASTVDDRIESATGARP